MRVRIPRFAVLVMAICLAPACSGDRLGGGNGWKVGPDAGSDAESDVGGEEPQAATFRLENGGEDAIWVLPPSPCRDVSPVWLDLAENDRNFHGSCDTCRCEKASDGRACSSCEPCAADQPIEQLKPGEAVEWDWAGRVFERDSVDGQTCERPTVPGVGTRIESRFCWRSDAAGDESTCETVEFQYGDDRITHVAGGEPEPVETTFKLTNESRWDLRLTPVSSCAQPEKPWVSLRHDDERVAFSGDCSICSCDDVENGGCAVCKKRCMPPTSRELAPGNTETLTWNGVGRRVASVDGRQCHEKWTPEPGTEMTAVFCFDPMSYDQSAAKLCRDVEFRYGRDTEVSLSFESRAELGAQKTDFVLKNRTGSSLYIEESGCDPDPAPWVDLERDGTQVDGTTDCTECSCRSVREDGTCAVCSPPCRPGKGEREIPPGDRASWTWQGHLYPEREVDGTQCVDKVTPALAATFDARFCWRPEGKRGEVCRNETFRYGETEEVVVAP